MTFDELDLDPGILDAIGYMGFREATPIQEKAIPVILEGHDLIACAQTGTGKTAAYLLPVMNDIAYHRPSHTHTLVLVPTRELALQIDQQIQGLAYTQNITSLAVYGGGEGSAWDQEKAALTHGADIIVATPGRLISHLNLGYVQFTELQVLVLDEADRMLDIGFHDDIMKIISFIPKKRQTLMFSATMPPKIRSLSKNIMKKPKEISLEMSKPADGVLQAVYLLEEPQKLPCSTASWRISLNTTVSSSSAQQRRRCMRLSGDFAHATIRWKASHQTWNRRNARRLCCGSAPDGHVYWLPPMC